MRLKAKMGKGGGAGSGGSEKRPEGVKPKGNEWHVDTFAAMKEQDVDDFYVYLYDEEDNSTQQN